MMRRLEIENVRLGLATNSSSSHSLIFLPKGAEIPETTEDTNFGWSFWTASSKEAKLNYLALTLEYALRGSLPQYVTQALVKQWTGRTLYTGYSNDGLPEGFDADGDIDHESIIALPREFGTNVPDKEFIEEFIAFIMQDEVVLLGGNDNETESHPLLANNLGDYVSSLFPAVDRSDWPVVCRKDGDHWTIFTEGVGKVRFRFPTAETLPKGTGIDKQWDSRWKTLPVREKLQAPELVDVKITDRCPYGCAYCYQASTSVGEEKLALSMYRIATLLAEWRVFEVAIGGGEPTLAANFESTLEYFRRDGIVPNFTTRNLDWLRDTKRAQRIMKLAGAVAFSVDNVRGAPTIKKMADLAALVQLNEIDPDRIYIQAIIGPGLMISNEYDLQLLVKTCRQHNFKLTLLGFKGTGFGAQYVSSLEPRERRMPDDPGWWVKVIQEMQAKDGWDAIGTIGVDTVLAAQVGELLIDIGVPSFLYRMTEGDTSCYIDAVVGKMGPSSYCDESEMTDISERFLEEEVIAAWDSF